MCNFRIGQKVVRVGSVSGDGGFYKGSNFSYPAMGEVCTVKTINHWPSRTLITLAEHDNAHLIPRAGGYEPGFNARCFRPVVEQKTDTGFAILEEIRRRESWSAPAPQRALSSTE